MVMNDVYIPIEDLTKSISSINSIEYKQSINIKGAGEIKQLAEIHYYYKKPYYLRIETKNQDNVNVDIYTPDGLYEYIPSSNTAYYREKWKDNKPISYQLEDKLQDIMIRGKYEVFKTEKVGDIDCEIIRCVDEYDDEVYEHRVWLGNIGGLSLPVMEEYLVDGDITSTYKYEYISVNKDLESSLFDIKKYKDIKIYELEGIPKLVKDEGEAEKYVGFNVIIPKYIPKDFTITEISIIPPADKPAVLILYVCDIDAIYFNQKNIKKNELVLKENEKETSADGKKFVCGRLYDGSIWVRWVKNGIEYEIGGNEKYKNEIVKLIQSITGSWISVD